MPDILSRPLLGTMLILLWFGVARAAVPAGTVVGVSGQCFVQAEGKRTPLKLGDAVHVADILDAPAGAKLKLRMNDGSVLSVAAGSQLTIGAYTGDANGKRQDVELSLAQGLMRAVVASVEHPATFEVKTAVGTAGVRSTDWFIEAQPGTTKVGVLIGSVSLMSNGTGVAVTVPARSGASVAAGQNPAAPRAWHQSEFNALIARTEQPHRRTTRPNQPPQGYIPSPGPAPQPQPEYSPGPGGYPPYPGGSPSGRYGSRPGGAYQPPFGGRGRNPGGTGSPSTPGGRGYQ
jgi:hypothetical protein